MLIFCRARKSDGLIDSVQRSGAEPSDLPASDANFDYALITEQQMAEMQSDMRHNNEGPLKWKLVGGQVQVQADTRPYLQITNTTGARVDEGTPITLQMQVKNAAGTNLNFTGSRPFIVEHNRVQKRVRIDVVNGQKTIVKAFAPGEWRIRSADPAAYYCAGDVSFIVDEIWV